MTDQADDSADWEAYLEAKAKVTILEDVLICECYCVSVSDIKRVCPEGSLDLEKVQLELNLGLGCQSCLNNRAQWIKTWFEDKTSKGV